MNPFYTFDADENAHPMLKRKVIKGGSWKDRAYWLNPGNRRFLDQDQSSDAIGFRCAMDRVGAPKSNYKENQRTGVDYSKK